MSEYLVEQSLLCSAKHSFMGKNLVSPTPSWINLPEYGVKASRLNYVVLNLTSYFIQWKIDA